MTRKPIFWILLVLGVSVAGCCLFTVAILGLGAVAESEGPSTPASSGAKWKIAVEVARGGSLTQALPGGRWVAQYGSNVDTVVARAGTTQWVQTNTSGSIYELVFDEDGTYAWNWAAGLTMYGQRSSSSATEKGSWSVSGTQLTLQPESQSAQYTNSSGTQDKTNQDLSERSYQVLDLTMETLDAPQERFPAVIMSGPKPAWNTDSGDQVKLTLQRLAN